MNWAALQLQFASTGAVQHLDPTDLQPHRHARHRCQKPIGVKVNGTDLATIDRIASQIEQVAKGVPGVSSALTERLTGWQPVAMA